MQLPVSNRIIIWSISLLLVVAGLFAGAYLVGRSQLLLPEAWDTDQDAKSVCLQSGKAVIQVKFTNKDNRAMDVTARDKQFGHSVDLGSVGKGETATGQIDTGLSSIGNGEVEFLLTWSDGGGGSDKRTENYNAIDCAPSEPTPTPTEPPELTPTPTEVPTPTPTVTLIPTPTPTVTLMPTPTPTVTLTPTPTPGPTSTPGPSATPTPGPTSTPTPGPTSTPTPGPTSTPGPEPTPTPTPTQELITPDIPEPGTFDITVILGIFGVILLLLGLL